MKSNDLITKAPTQLIAKVAGVEEKVAENASRGGAAR